MKTFGLAAFLAVLILTAIPVQAAPEREQPAAIEAQPISAPEYPIHPLSPTWTNPAPAPSAPAPDLDDSTGAITDDQDQAQAVTPAPADEAPADDTADMHAPAHYTIADLARSIHSLSAPYDASHHSIDEIGGL